MSVLIVTPVDVWSEHICKAFTENTSPLADERFEHIDSFERAMLALERVHDFNCIIIVAQKDHPQFGDFVTFVQKGNKGPLLIASDDPHILAKSRAKDIHFFVSPEKTDPRTLNHMLEAAKDRFKLHQSVTQLEEVYHLAEQRFRDVANHFSDWLWEIDGRMNLIYSSSNKRAMEKMEAGMSFIDCFLPEEQDRISDDFTERMASPEPFHNVEYWGHDPYGSRVCLSLSGVPVFNKNGTCTGFRGMGKDVSQQKTSADQLYFLANHDALTGLHNRARFTEEMARAFKRHLADNAEGAFILVNIDHFTYVNDTHGYDAGDRLIIHMAGMLRSCLRKGDFLARFNGDEFGILLRHTPQKEAEERVQKLLTVMEGSPFYYDNIEIRITGSAALVPFPAKAKTMDELFTRANIAMGQAKSNGRNSYSLFSESQLASYDVSRRLKMVDFVRRCLEKETERLKLYYQPIVSLTQDGPTRERYEVLVRLLDDHGDIVPPIQFIEIAEQHGLVSKIDEIVASRAIERLVEYQKQGRDISLSVNISGRTLEDRMTVQRIIDQIADQEILPGSLIFELTETAALVDLKHARKMIGEFKRHGACFALDDCGVGYSSLNYIRQLDLDFIKIDGSFIRDLHRGGDDDAFVSALRDVAKRMNIKTVAEMVEQEETVAKLQGLDIDYAQGYHFAVPVAEIPDEFPKVKPRKPKEE